LKNLAQMFRPQNDTRHPGETVFILAGNYREAADFQRVKRIQKMVFVDVIEKLLGQRRMVLYVIGTFYKRSDAEPIVARARMNGFTIKTGVET
jgi:predicted CopG family antitoxin